MQKKGILRDPIAQEQPEGYGRFVAYLRQPKGVLSTIDDGSLVGVYGLTEDPRYGSLTAFTVKGAEPNIVPPIESL